MAGKYVLVATFLFVLGLVTTTLAALQLVLPDLVSGTAYTTYGRLAPAGRALLASGWLTLAGLGLSFYVLSQITGQELRRKRLAMTALVLIAFGVFATAGALIGGLSSGIPGQEGPIWTRAISAIGYLAASLVITAMAKQRADRLGAAGWYITAASWWLTASALFGLIPLMSGIPGSIQAAFVYAGTNRLFAVSLAVGLLYFAFSKISGVDPTEPRPLAAPGLWPLTLVGAFMGGGELLPSAMPAGSRAPRSSVAPP